MPEPAGPSFRERLAVAGAILLLVVISRVGAGVVVRVQGGPPLGNLVPTLFNLPSLMLLLPLGLALAERRERRGGGWHRQLGFLAAYGSAATIVSFLYAHAISPPTWEEVVMGIGSFAALTFSITIVFLVIGVNVLRGLRWYRSAAAHDRRRIEAERAGAERTRRLIEQRFRPRVMIGILEEIARRSGNDPRGAEALLLRLARHERLLLEAPWTAVPFEQEVRFLRSCLALEGVDATIVIEGSGGSASSEATRAALAAIEEICRATPGVRLVVEYGEADGRLRLRTPDRDLEIEMPGETLQEERIDAADPVAPAPSASTTLAPLILYLLASILIDVVHALAGQRLWDVPLATLASLLVWLGFAPAVNAAAERSVRFRFAAAAAIALLVAAAGAASATAGGMLFLSIIRRLSADPPIFLPYLASRNLLVGLTLAAMSFAFAWGRILLRARAEEARASQSLLEAEARELEARFHPHFLLNALSAVAALIRRRPAAAAATCHRLADLIARTVASAGAQWWSLEEELQLVAGYAEIQKLRFGDRVRELVWEVDPSCGKSIVPRFVLQPLVENAFKHGVAVSRCAMDVCIAICERRHRLQIEVCNDSEPRERRPVQGNGLRFVDGRCRAAGGALTVEVARGLFIARCDLPLRRG